MTGVVVGSSNSRVILDLLYQPSWPEKRFGNFLNNLINYFLLEDDKCVYCTATSSGEMDPYLASLIFWITAAYCLAKVHGHE